MMRLGPVVIVLALGAAPSGWASPILTGSVTDARMCADPACDTVTMTLEATGPLPLTGAVTVNLGERQIVFDLTLESAVLRGADGIWTGLALQDLRFQGSATVDRLGSGWRLEDGTAQVDGTAVGINPLALAPAIPFSATAAVAGRCGIDWSCAVSLSPFAIPFEGGRYLGLALGARVPEPAVLVLVTIGIAVAAGLRLTRLIVE